MQGTIKDRFDKGEIVRVMNFSGLAHPKLVEAAAHIGQLHGIWFDQEHGAIDQARLEMVTLACRAGGVDCFARVPPTDYATVMRPMEAGCSGVMIAQVRTMEEVERAAAWSKFPPRGIRGTYGSNAEAGFGTIKPADYVTASNRDRWLAIQIETCEAVELAEQIAAVEDVTWLFVGPFDLSVNLGVPGDMLHPKCIEALERVSVACQVAGKPWGVLSPTAEHAQKCRDLGCQLFSIYSDMGCFRKGIAAVEEIFVDLMD